MRRPISAPYFEGRGLVELPGWEVRSVVTLWICEVSGLAWDKTWE